MANSHFHHFDETKFDEMLKRHALILVAYCECIVISLILNGFSLMIWPRFVKFVKFSLCQSLIYDSYIVKQVNLNPGSDEGELCTESSLATSSCFELRDVEISLSKCLYN